MATSTYSNNPLLQNERMNWSAVWAGTFTFLAIWTVFGALGLAIFASAANPRAAAPVFGMSVGMAIWAIVLTIIAMYVGAKATAMLARPASRGEGAVYGNTMFGLSVASVLVLIGVLGASASGGGAAANASVHSPYAISLVTGAGWAGFIALFLGWLAALGGASTTIVRKVNPNVTQMRPAA